MKALPEQTLTPLDARRLELTKLVEALVDAGVSPATVRVDVAEGIELAVRRRSRSGRQ